MMFPSIYTLNHMYIMAIPIPKPISDRVPIPNTREQNGHRFT